MLLPHVLGGMLIRRDAFLVLDLGLDDVYRIAGLGLQALAADGPAS